VRASGGTNNFLFVDQNGDDNTGTIDVRGNNNDAEVEQNGDDNIARIVITGDSNDSYIEQTGEDNVGTITIIGNGNEAEIEQGRTYLGEYGSYIRPADNNRASISLNGTYLDSTIRQGTSSSSGESGSFNNSATVVQTGVGNESFVRQNQSGNVARVNISGGGDTYLAENDSQIRQQNSLFVSNGTGGFSTGTPTQTNNPDTGNLADVAITGQGNESSVRQDGVQNRAIVSMLGGGSTRSTEVTGPNGGTIDAGRRAGNSSTVRQTGRGNFYEISSGGRNPGNGLNGRGNVSYVRQGSFTYGESGGTFGTNHTATVFQRGTLDTVNIRQDDNFSGATGDGRVGGSVPMSRRSASTAPSPSPRAAPTSPRSRWR
jgi:hypothetical protein